MEEPFFSIIVPTCNRPDYVKDCIASILNQSFSDFEIIVSDNGTTRLCFEVVKSFNDNRVVYKKPEKPLGMCDNYEFAQSGFKGKYFIVLGDKHRLYRDALENIHSVLLRNEMDVVSFKTEIFSVFDTIHIDKGKRDIQSGYVKNNQYSHCVGTIDSSSILKEKMEFIDPFGFEKGLIYGNSVYSRRLAEAIRQTNRNGRVFDGAIPDRYTSFVAIGLVNEIMYIDEPLSIYIRNGSHTSDVGKSSLAALESVWRKSNIKFTDKEFGKYVPLAECYGLVKNMQAGDYLLAIERLKNCQLIDEEKKSTIKHLKINETNFILGIEEELSDIPDEDPRHRVYNTAINEYYKKLTFAQLDDVKKKKSLQKRKKIKYRLLYIGFCFISKLILRNGRKSADWKFKLCNKFDRQHTYVKNLISYL